MATPTKQPELLPAGPGISGGIALDAETSFEPEAVKARGYWEQIWRRFKRDRVAIASIVFLVLLVLAVYPGAWIAERLLGHGPDDIFTDGIDEGFLPVGPMSRVTNFETGESQLLILGADGSLGRDLFLRLLYGGRVSLQVAFFSTIFVMMIGVTLGAAAGYFRGWLDTIVSRLTEITMAFPALLFAIALASTVGPQLNNVTFGGLLGEGVVTLILVFTLFGWFYPARIIRSKVLSLREKEFVEAALMTGASDWRIIKSHLLPHLVAPDHRLLDADRRRLHPRRGGPLLPRCRHPVAHGELGQPAHGRAGLLHEHPAADGVARARRHLHDARVQPARRRPPRRVRPAQPHVAAGHAPASCR